MSLPSRLLATINATEVLGRHASSICSIEIDLLALVHVGGSILSGEDVLAVASNRDRTSKIDLTPSVENLANKDTRLGFIKQLVHQDCHAVKFTL
ncbi:hypothetical protein IG631_19985 [Alternaria alternata]|nr:hypothetical protein IG631_19985 [Alternaria alternata]